MQIQVLYRVGALGKSHLTHMNLQFRDDQVR